ncbi:hypothetical protein [Actinomadura litoris]|uniref:hypothetical protein n=1 Tax=Actinomadura litoris TaxID=2678616 RepID=UPI001FA779E6|nr:hypothetical protein [Actinomadura litoris]
MSDDEDVNEPGEGPTEAEALMTTISTFKFLATVLALSGIAVSVKAAGSHEQVAAFNAGLTAMALAGITGLILILALAVRRALGVGEKARRQLAQQHAKTRAEITCQMEVLREDLVDRIQQTRGDVAGLGDHVQGARVDLAGLGDRIQEARADVAELSELLEQVQITAKDQLEQQRRRMHG